MNENDELRDDELPASAMLAVERIRNQPIPEDTIEQCLDGFLADNSGTRTIEPAANRDQPRNGKPRRSGRWLLAVAAALLLLTAGRLSLRPQVAWADIAAAVQEMPWVHLRFAESGSDVSEMWFAPSRQIVANRHGKNATHVNVTKEERFEFDPDSGTIFRLPLTKTESADSLNTVRELITSGEVGIGSEFSGFRVTDRESRSVDDGGRVWREFELHLKRSHHKMTMVVRVDPVRKLPIWLEYRTDKRDRRRFNITYPEDGPDDIYALGVSRDHKIVDRMPSRDLKAALSKLAEGYYGFGDYSAIVSHERGVPYRLIRRRDEMWRFDRCVPTNRMRPLADDPKQVTADSNDDAWWKSRLKQFDLQPLLVCDGENVYRYEADATLNKQTQRAGDAPVVPKRNPTAQGFAKADSDDSDPPPFAVPRVQRVDPNGPVRDRRGGRWSITGMADLQNLIIESLAYPPFNVSPEFEFNLNPAGDEGPKGTVVLEMKAVVPPSDSLRFRESRQWLDPSKGYAVVRHEIRGFRDLNLKHDSYRHVDKSNQVREFNEFRKTPTGHHYPTVVVWKDVVVKDQQPDQEKRDITTFFHLDFETHLPDELFDPQAAANQAIPLVESVREEQ